MLTIPVGEKVSTIFGHVRTSPVRLAAWALSWLASGTAYSLLDQRRDTLPEPIDVADHVGNMPDSIMWGGIGGLATSMILRLSAMPSTVRRTAFAGAVTAGVLANAIAETRTGQRLFDIEGMGRNAYSPNQDAVDFCYGTLAATATATVVSPQPNRFARGVLEWRSKTAPNKQFIPLD